MDAQTNSEIEQVCIEFTSEALRIAIQGLDKMIKSKLEEACDIERRNLDCAYATGMEHGLREARGLLNAMVCELQDES
jgi:hypothetical protein